MKHNTKLLFIGLFLCLCGSLAAQSITVSGNITDSAGEAFPGVGVSVKGTTVGTVCDLDGNYSIAVPSANSGFAQFEDTNT